MLAADTHYFSTQGCPAAAVLPVTMAILNVWKFYVHKWSVRFHLLCLN